MTEPVTVQLSTAIIAHGDEVKQLTFQPVKGKHIRACGLPYAFGNEGIATIDVDAAAKLMANLANVPLSSIDQLAASDWNACLSAMMRDFGAPTPA